MIEKVKRLFAYIMAKKLQSIEVEERLKDLGFIVFTPREFRLVFDVSKKSASMFILNNVKKGLFLKLRNNLYLLKDSRPSHYFIANKLYEPSYVSLETALSRYGIIPETVYAITSITTKGTREYDTPIGSFMYQRVKKQAYTGYGLKEIDGRKAFIAEPEKALADHLYFVDLKKKLLNDRLNLKNINKSKLIAFIKLFDRPGMLGLVKCIYAEYRKPRKIY
jgi:predicted transcriptional regulator of viral defense system